MHRSDLSRTHNACTAQVAALEGDERTKGETCTAHHEDALGIKGPHDPQVKRVLEEVSWRLMH
jgi:hypothetical protein